MKRIKRKNLPYSRESQNNSVAKKGKEITYIIEITELFLHVCQYIFLNKSLTKDFKRAEVGLF